MRTAFRCSVRPRVPPVMVALWAAALMPLVSSKASSQQLLTLEEALDLALSRSPGYAQAVVSVENAEETRRTAIGAFLPSLSLSTGASMRPGSVFDPTRETQVSATNRSLTGGVSVGMDLFAGGRNRAELNRSTVEIDAANANLEGQRFQLILQTKQLFFSALEQAELLDVAQARVERAEESMELVRRQVAAGAATASDSLRTRLELANARQAALQSEAQLRASRMSLGRQVGIPGLADALPPADLDPLPLPLSDEEIYALAELNSPDVRASELSARANEESVASARSAYLPSARISSGYNWSNNEWGFGGGDAKWNGLSLSLSYTLFNGFNRESNVVRAENQLRIARLQEDDTRLRAREEADAALFAIRTAEQAVQIAEEASAVAEEDLRVVLERFEVGVATVFEVVTSQVALDEAEANRVSARYDYLLARAELESILGREL